MEKDKWYIDDDVRYLIRNGKTFPILGSDCTERGEGYTIVKYNDTIAYISDNEIHSLLEEGKSHPNDLTVAIKKDTGKPRFDLLPWDALEEVAKVLEFGANKYEDHNWRKGFKWSRLTAACLRHLKAFMTGEDKDPETKMSHIAHAMCCLLFLLEHQMFELGEDDRYIYAKRKENSTME